ncbi:MAG: glycosyltransferase [Elusimicrobiota bacterium]
MGKRADLIRGSHRPVQEVHISPLPLMRFHELLEEGDFQSLVESVRDTDKALKGRVIWNVNSTATGGGVAEVLHTLLGYTRGAGVDARWMVMTAKPDFFQVTKRLHNMIQGEPGDEGALDAEAREVYESTIEVNAQMLEAAIQPKDVVILYDPQAAGLVPALKKRGAVVVWDCHIGTDTPNELSRQGWEFLLPYVRGADAYVFSCRQFIPEGLDASRVEIIPPSIDAFSPKNQGMDPVVVQGVLYHIGLVGNAMPRGGFPIFRREDESPARVDHRAEIVRYGPAPDFGVPLVVQVSRWDRLKDPLGVLQGFAEHVAPQSDAHLVLAGPAVQSVSDDPEGARSLADTVRLWRTLPDGVRARVQLACLPMLDIDENAAIVNALQRYASVLVQKSLHEGFWLTVTEAMWKAKPVVASAVAGVMDQIQDGTNGMLLKDPSDLGAFGAAVLKPLKDPALAARLGEEAQKTVRRSFLNNRHLIQYFKLLKRLLT